MRRIILIAFLIIYSATFSQVNFNSAYQNHPFVPKGLLEAVAWTNTRMVHLDQSLSSCTGMPKAFGIMGLHDDGQGYFIENGQIVEDLSGISISDQKASAQSQILAYAKAFNHLMGMRVASPSQVSDPSLIRTILFRLSEIPDSGLVNLMARDMQVYEILKFMSSSEQAMQYGFTPFHFDLPAVFGAANYKVLSSSRVKLSKKGIRSEDGSVYSSSELKSAQYGPAIWNPAAPCNFSSRQGVAISAITIHTVQGTYAGCISWFQNCAASVSAHYVIRSSDGQVTQMVDEADKAWHVGTENPYTIGYEHEGYVNNAAWYTEEMYASSANLSKDVVNSGYGINPLRTFDGPATSGTNVLGNCIRIKGHQHYQNQTHVDPGINWNWEHYYQLINDPPSIITLTSTVGTIYDTGGPTGNYPDDERQLWLIQPPGAQSITVNFTAFSLENNWDYLYIYDGDTLTSNLIGIYTGTSSPGTIVSTTGSLLIEFRSDCATVAPGWAADYTITVSDATPPNTQILNNSIWHNNDFIIDFVDTDAQSGVDERFYLVAKKNINDLDWNSISPFGFGFESFENGSSNWTDNVGVFSLTNGSFEFNDVNEQNSNSYMSLAQNNSSAYLFEWDQIITSNSTNQRAGMHFFCDDPTLPNRGNSYFIYLRENDDKVQIYSVDNDVFTLQADVSWIINSGQTYNVKTMYDPQDGNIEVYIDDTFVAAWQDITPLTSGAYISLRSGGCSVAFDNIFVYRSRGIQALLPAGFSEMLDIESESAVATAMARSIVIDSADNWSLPFVEPLLLDFTPPDISFLFDGSGAADIDTFQTNMLEGNWDAFDIHSDIAYFEVAVGTLPYLDDVFPWTNSGSIEAFSTVINNPVYDQVYYLSVRAYNNAGLFSQFMSDGQRYIDNVGLHVEDLNHISVYPNPAQETVYLEGVMAPHSYEIYSVDGSVCGSGITSGQIDVSSLSNGTYNLIIKQDSAFVIKRILIKH